MFRADGLDQPDGRRLRDALVVDLGLAAAAGRDQAGQEPERRAGGSREDDPRSWAEKRGASGDLQARGRSSWDDVCGRASVGAVRVGRSVGCG